MGMSSARQDGPDSLWPIIPATPELVAEIKLAASINAEAGAFVASTPLLDSLRNSLSAGFAS